LNILIIGAGVIGSTYGWQLLKAGCDITHLVRPETLDEYKTQGMAIRYLDLRGASENRIEEEYHPNFVDKFNPSENYQYIIVAVNGYQLIDILPVLNVRSGNATIVFLQNMRLGDDELISRCLDPAKYIIAYPLKAGGGRQGNIIYLFLFSFPSHNGFINRRVCGKCSKGMFNTRQKR